MSQTFNFVWITIHNWGGGGSFKNELRLTKIWKVLPFIRFCTHKIRRINHTDRFRVKRTNFEDARQNFVFYQNTCIDNTAIEYRDQLRSSPFVDRQCQWLTETDSHIFRRDWYRGGRSLRCLSIIVVERRKPGERIAMPTKAHCRSVVNLHRRRRNVTKEAERRWLAARFMIGNEEFTVVRLLIVIL